MVDETMEAWVVDLEKALANSLAEAEGARWTAHSIYRVPARMKSLDAAGAYKPRTVSLGPYHHGDPDLLPMEVHKRRALRHVVRRSGKTVREFVASVDVATEQLESAYADLGDEWRGPGRSRFLQVMVTDGCFLLEVMRMDAAQEHVVRDYAPNDPVFSRHGLLYIGAHIKVDMVIMENQLPLLLLQKIIALENVDNLDNKDASQMVLKFLSMMRRRPLPAGTGRPALHPLDLIRRTFLSVSGEDKITSITVDKGDTIPSASALHRAGIRFKDGNTTSPQCISFQKEKGELTLPRFIMDDSSEYMFLNMMAFEHLHAGAGNDVTEFVQFMGSIILSAQDVRLLRSKEIVENKLNEDEAVVSMFKRLAADSVLVWGGTIGQVYQQVNMYIWSRDCRNLTYWRTHFVDHYFHTPWKAISLFAGTLLLMLTIVQTVYSVLSFYSKKN